MNATPSSLLMAIALLPLAGFVLNGLLGNRLGRRFVTLVGCGLPIVARKDLVIDRASVFAYDVGAPSSVRDALLAAKAAGRDLRLGDTVRSWDDLAVDLLGDLASGSFAPELIVGPMTEEVAPCAS